MASGDRAIGRLLRRSNLVTFVTLRKGNHVGESIDELIFSPNGPTELSFLTGALTRTFKFKKVDPFKSTKMFYTNPFLALLYSLISSIIFLHLYFLPSAAFS